jgi:hypothetical protein
MPERDFYWMRTVGGPTPDDQRDGELHKALDDGDLPAHEDIEPWDERDEQDDEDIEAILSRGYDPATQFVDRYWRNPNEPAETHEDGRPIWNYYYHPHAEPPSWF